MTRSVSSCWADKPSSSHPLLAAWKTPTQDFVSISQVPFERNPPVCYASAGIGAWDYLTPVEINVKFVVYLKIDFYRYCNQLLNDVYRFSKNHNHITYRLLIYNLFINFYPLYIYLTIKSTSISFYLYYLYWISHFRRTNYYFYHHLSILLGGHLRYS